MRRSLTIAALCVLVSSAAFAVEIYVNQAATGANDGSSWADAFTDLQAGIAAATPGDQVWVVSGTYKPTSTADRTISFVLKNGVGIYGGFEGDEVVLGERSFATPTILSGDIGVVGNVSDNSYHVVLVPNTVTLSGVLDGFVITEGRADGLLADNNERGGGMWVNGGSPTLANLSLNNNFASFEGGGMRVFAGGPSLDHVSFNGNVVGVGGAGGGLKSGAGSAVTCRNCVFRQNVLSGAILGAGGVEGASGLSLINCEIAQNNPSGIRLISDSNGIQNCTIANNVAYGIELTGSNSNGMTNSIVWGNGTGGIFNSGSSSITISYSDLQEGAIGTGNISLNPAFVAPPGNLRLGPGSPAVDAADNAAVPAGVIQDIAGLPRFFDDPSVPDTGAGTAPIVDMGAHERVPLSVTAPSGLDLCAGADAVFSVVAAGQPTLTYQWRQDGIPLANGGRISGADTHTLTIADTIPTDAGDYDVVVTDGVGQSIISAAATLTVATAPAAPTITAPISVTVGSTGNIASVVNNPGSIWNWTLSGGTITGGQGTNQITFDAGPPGTTMIATVTETVAGCTSPVASFTIQVDFLDVPPADPLHDFVISIARAGITAGCGGGNYCPNNPVTRAQMAVFLLKAEHGSGYSPPPCTTPNVFTDVPCPSTYANWIQQLAAEGITSGCGGGSYCPDAAVTREQMAVFLLKTLEGSTYDPPDCTQVFADVPCTPGTGFSDWIVELFNRGITSGCGGGNYCPTNPNTRGQMAVFLTLTFNLP